MLDFTIVTLVTPSPHVHPTRALCTCGQESVQNLAAVSTLLNGSAFWPSGRYQSNTRGHTQHEWWLQPVAVVRSSIVQRAPAGGHLPEEGGAAAATWSVRPPTQFAGMHCGESTILCAAPRTHLAG